MKRVGLAALGVVAACAACCAIPLAVPFVGMLSMAGLASVGLDAIPMGVVAKVAVSIVAAGALGRAGTRVLAQRRKPCVPAPKLESCAFDANTGSASCACSEAAS